MPIVGATAANCSVKLQRGCVYLPPLCNHQLFVGLHLCADLHWRHESPAWGQQSKSNPRPAPTQILAGGMKVLSCVRWNLNGGPSGLKITPPHTHSSWRLARGSCTKYTCSGRKMFVWRCVCVFLPPFWALLIKEKLAARACLQSAAD